MLELDLLAQDVAQFALVTGEALHCLFGAVAAQGQHESGGDAQVRADPDLAHGDGHARQVGVVQFAPHQHVGEGPADQFADAQLALRGTGIALKLVLCHAAHVRRPRMDAKRGGAGRAQRWAQT
jgi:hypothetical protein